MRTLRWAGLAALTLTLAAVAFAQGRRMALTHDPARCQFDAQGASASICDLRETAQRRAPSGKAEVRFLAQGEEAFVAELRLAPRATVPEHRDPTEEYIHVLSGGGILYVEDVAFRLGPGRTAFMPAGAKVRYENGAEETVALQIFAGPGPAKKYGAWAAPAK